MQVGQSDNIIRFILDGELKLIQFEAGSDISIDTSLLRYLRSIGHTGVKEGCGEGDCGACTVVIARPYKNQLHYQAINSCLVFLPMVHGCQVITVHNLSSPAKDGPSLHPVQHAMVEHHGSQCGYCTPGIVMSIFALWKNHKHFTPELVKEGLAGNLCRCTGYQPIIDALMSLSGTDRDDHFRKSEDSMLEMLLAIKKENHSIIIDQEERLYLKPASLPEALEMRKSYPAAMIINGATDIAVAVNKGKREFGAYLDISLIDELRFIRDEKEQLVFGPCVSINELGKISASLLPALSDMISLFGSQQIRNMASPGGNIASASPIGDLLPVLMAYGCELEISKKEARRTVILEDFILDYHKIDLQDTELITAIRVPVPNKEETIRAYKVSKRKDVDISTVSAAFLIRTDNNSLVQKISLYFGGMAATVVRATKAESFLLGKKWTESIASEASKIIGDQLIPISDARSTASGRKIIAENLLMKFFEDTASLL